MFGAQKNKMGRVLDLSINRAPFRSDLSSLG